MDEPLVFSITFFSFLILLRTSLVIHGGLVLFFTVKVGMHISAAASNKSLTLSVLRRLQFFQGRIYGCSEGHIHFSVKFCIIS